MQLDECKEYINVVNQGHNQTSKNEEAPSDRAPQARVEAPKGVGCGEGDTSSKNVSVAGEGHISPLPIKICHF